MRPQLPPPNLKIVVEGGCVQDVEGDFEFTYEVEDRDNPACFCQHCGVAVDGQHFHNCQAYKIESERI